MLLAQALRVNFMEKNHPNIYLSNNSLEQAEWNSMLFKLSLIMEGATEKVSQFKMTQKSRTKILFKQIKMYFWSTVVNNKHFL